MQMESTQLPEEHLNNAEQPSNEAATPAQEEKSEAQTSSETVKENEEAKDTSPKVDYEKMALTDFPNVLKELLGKSNWMKLGQEIKTLESVFSNLFKKELQEKKAAFIEEGGNEIDFYFLPEYKKQFDLHFKEYRAKKHQYYKDIEASQKANLNRKREIIEGIKELVDKNPQDNSTYKHFKHLQEAFHTTGQVPRNESNNIWETYKFHVERFYDFLHLNRDLREADFKHNYEEKLKIIERAEVLVDLPDVIAATRELNSLHRMWKNDLGPVAKIHREELWERFQKATKQIHQRKNEYNKNIDSIQVENLAAKEAILNNIMAFVDNPPKNHNAWQNALKKVEDLKASFYSAGRVPKQESKRIWNKFREAGRSFNHAKNQFYKSKKVEEKQLIENKKALINQVKAILERPNWRDQVQQVKKMQSEWKSTGRISRRMSKKLWEEFQSLTNLYFDRYKNKATALSQEEKEKQQQAVAWVEEVIAKEAPTTPKKLEQFIDEQAEAWLSLQPQPNSQAQRKLIQHLVKLWEATSLSAKEKAVQKFNTQLALIKNDADGLNKEHTFLKKKIDEINTELIQLQNNLQFFSSSSNDNPVVVKVTSKIDKLSTQKEGLEEKANAVKSVKKNLKKREEANEENDQEELNTAD